LLRRPISDGISNVAGPSQHKGFTIWGVHQKGIFSGARSGRAIPLLETHGLEHRPSGFVREPGRPDRGLGGVETWHPHGLVEMGGKKGKILNSHRANFFNVGKFDMKPDSPWEYISTQNPTIWGLSLVF
jgi:hypothetical protein